MAKSLARKLATIRANQPIPGDLVPGFGQTAWDRAKRAGPPPTYDGPPGGGRPQWGGGRQRAPYKRGPRGRGRTPVRRGTPPTPGSADRRNRRQYD